MTDKSHAGKPCNTGIDIEKRAFFRLLGLSSIFSSTLTFIPLVNAQTIPKNDATADVSEGEVNYFPWLGP